MARMIEAVCMIWLSKLSANLADDAGGVVRIQYCTTGIAHVRRSVKATCPDMSLSLTVLNKPLYFRFISDSSQLARTSLSLVRRVPNAGIDTSEGRRPL